MLLLSVVFQWSSLLQCFWCVKTSLVLLASSVMSGNYNVSSNNLLTVMSNSLLTVTSNKLLLVPFNSLLTVTCNKFLLVQFNSLLKFVSIKGLIPFTMFRTVSSFAVVDLDCHVLLRMLPESYLQAISYNCLGCITSIGNSMTNTKLAGDILVADDCNVTTVALPDILHSWILPKTFSWLSASSNTQSSPDYLYAIQSFAP